MATLHRIVFLLVCAFLLQEIQTQNFHYSESSSSSRTSSSENANFKKEIKLVNDKTNAVMGEACKTMQALNLKCSWGSVDRRFLGNLLSEVATRFINSQMRMLYTIVHLCGKIIKCINMVLRHLTRAVIGYFPPCIQQRLVAIKQFFSGTLESITEILRKVFAFIQDVGTCTSNMGNCVKTIFESIFHIIMRIIKSIISQVTETANRIFFQGGTCQPMEAENDPQGIIIRFGKCFFCSFMPTSSMCG